MLMAMALLASTPVGAPLDRLISSTSRHSAWRPNPADAPLINSENLFRQAGSALVALLIGTLPFGAALNDFAPKGGTEPRRSIVPRSVLPNVEEGSGFTVTQVVSFSDLYGRKIVVALDRNILAIF
ncbi:hypothetical protein [Bradyrhizobium cosmicum]|uniref:hypothetical protein n=1 Tax=Bradyrhizobium cosmicum TaxID=1404864 RepID=UPI0028E98787|nr:hypothetical protein [Bradyrhizobium cosmicum]